MEDITAQLALILAQGKETQEALGRQTGIIEQVKLDLDKTKEDTRTALGKLEKANSDLSARLDALAIQVHSDASSSLSAPSTAPSHKKARYDSRNRSSSQARPEDETSNDTLRLSGFPHEYPRSIITAWAKLSLEAAVSTEVANQLEYHSAGTARSVVVKCASKAMAQTVFDAWQACEDTSITFTEPDLGTGHLLKLGFDAPAHIRRIGGLISIIWEQLQPMLKASAKGADYTLTADRFKGYLQVRLRHRVLKLIKVELFGDHADVMIDPKLEADLPPWISMKMLQDAANAAKAAERWS